MMDTSQKTAAGKFAADWKNKGYEKGQSQTFWLTLLSDVLGVSDVGNFITFEEQVKLDHTSFIDGIIPSTHVLIEQKSVDKNLKAAIRQSDGSLLSPFQQAKRYAAELPYSQRPRWIVICNFAEFHVYDMERPGGDPKTLGHLNKLCVRLVFCLYAKDAGIFGGHGKFHNYLQTHQIRKAPTVSDRCFNTQFLRIFIFEIRN